MKHYRNYFWNGANMRLSEDFYALFGFLAKSVVVETAGAVGRAGKSAAKSIKQWKNYRPPRYRLLSCPTPAEVMEQWHKVRGQRNPLEALKFGAMLLNITQYVDASPIYNAHGRVVARNPGVKGWLKEHCEEINYVTAMGYRKFAEKVTQVIQLPEYMPLEWVLPGTESLDKTRNLNPENQRFFKIKAREMLGFIATCRQRLGALLADARSVNQVYGRIDLLTGSRRQRVSAYRKLPATSENLNFILSQTLEMAQELDNLANANVKEELLRQLQELNIRLQNLTA